MAFVGGWPASVGYDSSTQDLVFTHSTTSTGNNAADWPAPVLIDGSASVAGFSREIIEVDCKSAVAYISGGDLIYIRSTTATGESVASWSSPLVIDSGSMNYCILLEVDGKAGIAYIDNDATGDVKFAVIQ